jgi:hypothetical protein
MRGTPSHKNYPLGKCPCCGQFDRITAPGICQECRRRLNVAKMYKTRRLPRAVAICCAMLLSVASWAADVSLAWDHSISEGVLGYRMYYGNASRTYSAHDEVPYQTTWTVTGLGSGIWYFAATAFDTNGNESNFSNEVSTTIGAPSITCDINGDASINILDLQALSNKITVGGTIDSLFDLNGDGAVNVLDLQILANVILGFRTCP